MTKTEHNNRWLKKNPEKRNAYRKANYAAGRYGNGSHPWTPNEIEVMKRFEGTDRQLAEHLGRSVQSIQTKRCRLKG